MWRFGKFGENGSEVLFFLTKFIVVGQYYNTWFYIFSIWTAFNFLVHSPSWSISRIVDVLLWSYYMWTVFLFSPFLLHLQDSLRTFLLRKLDNLDKDDKCQITMISTWTTELYLDKVCFWYYLLPGWLFGLDNFFA